MTFETRQVSNGFQDCGTRLPQSKRMKRKDLKKNLNEIKIEKVIQNWTAIGKIHELRHTKCAEGTYGFYDTWA